MVRAWANKVLVLWVVLLVGAPLVVWTCSGDTDVIVGVEGGAVWAEMPGTRLEVPGDKLDVGEAGRLRLPGLSELRVEAGSSSLYWQPGKGGLWDGLGAIGEWVQALRPPSGWSAARVNGEGRAEYTLKGGRALAVLPLDDGTRNGVALVLRPERASFAWWTLEDGEPGQVLASTSYRPSGWVSLGDLTAEVALVAWVGSLLGVAAWLAGWMIRRIRREGGAEVARPTNGGAVWKVRLRTWHPALVLFMAGTVLAAVVCIAVLDGIPHVQDDVAYLFQAKIFALGRSWVPTPPAPEFFQNGFVQMFEGRWFSKYPPGYPLLLVPGVWAGMPWLINALSCGVSLALVYLAGLRMFGVRVATWAGLLGLISPWVLFMSGSYMSHPTTMMWAALFLYGLVGLRLAARDEKSLWWGAASRWGLVAGFAIGMAFITREWTALGIGLGGAVWALGDIVSGGGRARKAVAYGFVVGGFVPPVLFLLYQNHELTGSWTRLAQDLVGSYDTPGFGPGHGSAEGHTPAQGLYNGLVYLRTLATMFDGWPVPLALAPVALGAMAWIGGRRTEDDRLAKWDEGSNGASVLRWEGLLWLPLVGLVGAYFLWWSSTTIYGPRYWYEGMPFLLLMAGRGLDLLGRVASSGLDRSFAGRVRWLVPGVLFAVMSVYGLGQTLPVQARSYVDYNDISAQPLREVEVAHLGNALVFVALEPTRSNRDYGKVFFANDPLLQGNVVYARDMGPEANRYLASLFPGRSVYWLPLVGPPRAGVGP